ncbi:M48 family metallopeptidase [Faecalispora sporosphaeroides]|jgi:predicted metal-dependent hydrolase|uniref:M48 family metallopeptidase n=1 Tax=Faecalispora sporosphaeroides TaxID=1549 RepID=UPI00037ED4F4|nr:SprT family zinc-dependent metalloprotease [Faecalispora sporosphaeroides]
MRNEEMIIGGLPIKIIRKKNLKNLYIRVNPPEGDVTVSTPAGLNDEDIELFVLRKLPEITKVRDRMLAQERQSKREYVSGESYYLWGKPYRLQVVYEETRHKIVKTPTKIIMTVPEGTNTKAREKLLIEWYRQELKRILETVAIDCEKKTGIHAEDFRIKNMRTRWGTCNIDKRRIWINLQLAKKPMECLEYVVIHELVHLVEKNHTHRFRALVEEFCPTWKEVKKILATMPLDYMEKEEKDTDDEQTDIERYL